MQRRMIPWAFAAMVALSGTAEAAYTLTPLPNPVTLGSDVTFTLSGVYTDLLALTVHVQWDSTRLSLFDTAPNHDFPGASDPNSFVLAPSSSSAADFYFAGSCDDVLVACPTAASNAPVMTLSFHTLDIGTAGISVGGLDINGLPTGYTDNSGLTVEFAAQGSVDIIPGVTVLEPSSFMLLATGALAVCGQPALGRRRRRRSND